MAWQAKPTLLSTMTMVNHAGAGIARFFVTRRSIIALVKETPLICCGNNSALDPDRLGQQ